MLSIQEKLMILTQAPPNGPQVSHWESCVQKTSQCWATAFMGVAEVDDAKAATTARAIAEEKRIVSEDVIWDRILLKKIVIRLAFM
ncbi:hypothetical protein P692DRAFT_20408208 [Suillus brevipes Sb2]|nr:hypothetical protein P692DRAFT_20408208 [Suillus brevipes Sb2]